MPVLAELQPLLERIRAAGTPDDSAPIAERRAQVHAGIEAQQAHMVEPVPLVSHVDHAIAVAGGEIIVRLYRLADVEVPGCHIFVHGGGWWMGTLDQSDLACSRIVHSVGCAVADRFPSSARPELDRSTTISPPEAHTPLSLASALR
jgi:acetyl esterase